MTIDPQAGMPAEPGPHATTEPITPPRRARRWPWIVGAVVVVAALAGGLTWWLVPTTEDEAIDRCHDAIRDKLYAPSTAAFADEVERDIEVGIYRLNGELDAQNKLGGTIRGEYFCVLRHEEDGSWVTMEARVISR
ncbi:hypothetical protein ACWCHM_26205 [Micromonospora sp. SCSIO 07396]